MSKNYLCFLLFCALPTAGCGHKGKSNLDAAAPGGSASDININGRVSNIGPGKSIGSENVKLTISDYLKPSGTPFTWTTDMTQSVLVSLPTSCDGTTSPDSNNVAVTVDRTCKVLDKAAASDEIANLGAMYASHGVNLVDIVANAASSSELKRVDAALPRVDLGAIIKQQMANAANDIDSLELGLGLAGERSEDGWVGGARNYSIGSNQFATSASGYFFVKNKDGLGLHSSADVTAKAFGVQRSLVFANLEANALSTDQSANLNMQIQVFGQDAYHQSFSEPSLSGQKTFLTLDHTYPGTVNFAVGPVPFKVAWSIHVTGSVPASYEVRPTSIKAGLNPEVKSTVSLEGGAEVKLAKAGVDGTLTVSDARVNGDGVIALSTDDSGKPTACFNAKIDMNLQDMLSGSLSAYAQIGRPDKKLSKIPLGWRGDMKFVDWTGSTYDLPVISAQNKCL